MMNDLRQEIQRLDYRPNLIIDKDNPVLIQKAWRDRYSDASHWKAGYGGRAYLAQPWSEDALTWNVFRTLQKAGSDGLVAIQKACGLSAVVRTVLFWGCDVESGSECQQYLSCLIRAFDGRHRGTMTEPDLVVVTENEVAFIECKLNVSGRLSPWRAQGNGAEKRFRTYIECGFGELSSIERWRDVYQLLRQYVYALGMSKLLRVRPMVIPLVNAEHLESLNPYYGPLTEFNEKVFLPFATWQGVRQTVLDTCAEDLSATILRKLDEALQPRP